VRVPPQPHAEVDVRLGMLGSACPADRAHRLPLGDRRLARRRDRPEVKERDRVPVGGLDRDGEPAPGHGPGEADDAGRRSPHGGAAGSADVDAAVLPRGVGVLSEDERS
jgi:hypothetical protein